LWWRRWLQKADYTVNVPPVVCPDNPAFIEWFAKAELASLRAGRLEELLVWFEDSVAFERQGIMAFRQWRRPFLIERRRVMGERRRERRRVQRERRVLRLRPGGPGSLGGSEGGAKS
jgi:hypothetical protein